MFVGKHRRTMKRITPLLLGLAGLLALFTTGCTSVVKCPPYPTADSWSGEVKTLGPVKADSGKWPLSLHQQPSDYTYYSALVAKAESLYGVPKAEIILSEVDVKLLAEMDGTIRDWKASATAGQKKVQVTAGKTPTDTLVALKKLLDAGAITQAEYDAKKKELLGRL